MQKLTLVQVCWCGPASCVHRLAPRTSPVAEKKPVTPDALQAEIKALKAPKVAWRRSPGRAVCSKGFGKRAPRTSRPCSGSSSTGPLTTRAAEGTPPSPVR